MTIKWGPQIRHANKVDKQRRKLLKLAAVGSAGLITSPWMFQSSRAAAKTIKIGQITPETGPIAAFGEPSKWVADEVSKFLGDGIVVAGEKHPSKFSTGQPVESEPRVGRGGRSDQQRQGRHHDRFVDVRYDQSGRRSVRARRRALHHLRRSVAVVVLRPQGRSEEGLRVDLPLLLGLRHGRQYVRRHVVTLQTNKIVGDHADQRSRRHRRQQSGARAAGDHQRPRLRRALTSAFIRRCPTTSRRRSPN